MIERLGHVLYWTGCIFAALTVASGIGFGLMLGASGHPPDVASAPWVGGAIAASAIVPWLIGRACRYIFSNS